MYNLAIYIKHHFFIRLHAGIATMCMLQVACVGSSLQFPSFVCIPIPFDH